MESSVRVKAELWLTLNREESEDDDELFGTEG